MEFLKQWTLCVCVSLIAAVILSLFAPRGNMNRFYKILISFFVFVSFLYPLKDGGLKNLKIDGKAAVSSSSYDEDKPYRELVETQVESVLKKNKIDGAAVECEVEKDGKSGEITVKSVRVAVADKYDRETVENIIFNSLGINAEVTGIGD